MSVRDVTWKVPGPVAARFYHSTALVQTLQGPVGSGKTIECLMKGIKRAKMQPISRLDGKRHYQLTCVRDTYRQLWRSTVPSWNKWVPQTTGHWSGGKDEPVRHAFQVPLPDRTVAEVIFNFAAIGDNDIEEFMRGYETTDWYLNEADLLHEDVFELAVTRLGRYPDPSHNKPIGACVMMDANAPDIDSWLYQRGFLESPEWWDYFVQPGGMDPAAENIENLDDHYYTRQVLILKDERKINKLVHNKCQFGRDGKPVFDKYDDMHHCALEDLAPIPELPLRLGLDAGGQPAMVMFQRLPNGQWRGLDELVATNDEVMGAARFAEELNVMLDGSRYRGFRRADIQACADPSAEYGADRRNDELDWIQSVSAATGIRIRPARTNNLTTRLAAVQKALKPIDARTPGMLLSPRQKVLRTGFIGSYRFRRVQVAGGRWDDKPDKHQDASHPHDALQYMLLDELYDEVLGRQRHLRRQGGWQRRALSDESRDPAYAGDDDELSRPARHRSGIHQRYAEG